MQLITKIPIAKADNPIDYNSRIFSVGSCFAVCISEKLHHFGFQQQVNPLGILFHPKAIEKLIDYSVYNREFLKEDLFFHNERCHCFAAHSELSNSDPNLLRNNLNSKIAEASDSISMASHVIVTLGTAWVYRLKSTSEIVANCHKIPQNRFTKELLAIHEIEESLQNIITHIRTRNSQAQLIFTISPVRHLKDGFVENQRSKSNLISALHNTLQENPTASYFPSYEIMMDELRDYRFYSADMIHPSAIAVDYIWQRFSEAWISRQTSELMSKVGSVRNALAHRPFNSGSEEHRKFVEKTEAEKARLMKILPHLQF